MGASAIMKIIKIKKKVKKLCDMDIKAAVRKMFQRAIMDTLEKKYKNRKTQQNKRRWGDETNGNFKIKKNTIAKNIFLSSMNGFNSSRAELKREETRRVLKNVTEITQPEGLSGT